MNSVEQKIRSQTPQVLALFTDRREGDRRAPAQGAWLVPLLAGAALFLTGLLVGLLAH